MIINYLHSKFYTFVRHLNLQLQMNLLDYILAICKALDFLQLFFFKELDKQRTKV